MHTSLTKKKMVTKQQVKQTQHQNITKNMVTKLQVQQTQHKNITNLNVLPLMMTNKEEIKAKIKKISEDKILMDSKLKKEVRHTLMTKGV